MSFPCVTFYNFFYIIGSSNRITSFFLNLRKIILRFLSPYSFLPSFSKCEKRKNNKGSKKEDGRGNENKRESKKEEKLNKKNKAERK